MAGWQTAHWGSRDARAGRTSRHERATSQFSHSATCHAQAAMKGGIRVLLVVALAAAGCPLWAQSGLTGVWRIDEPVAALHTANGGEPPLRAEAAKRYQVHIAERRNGDLTSFDSAALCASVGMPRIMTINSPFEIVVRPPYVALLHEWNWWARSSSLEGWPVFCTWWRRP